MINKMGKRNLMLFPRLAYGIEADDFLGNQYLSREGLRIVNKLIEWYRQYDGKHWIDEETGKEITPADLKLANDLDYLPTMITINLTAWFIDRLAAFMFERPLGLACEAEQVDGADAIAKPGYKPSTGQQKANATAAAREQLLYRIIKQNLMHEKLLKAATDFHVGTAVCAKLHYDENRGLRIVWRPRLEFWPIYDPDDVDLLQKIHFVAFMDDDTIWKQTYWMQDGSCWMEEGYFNTELKLKEVIVAPGDIGLPFIPVEIFTRGGLTGETEGRSLVETLKDLNTEVEHKVSDNSDSLRFGMFAIKIILNAMLPTKEEIRAGQAEAPKIAPNALWTLSGDSEAPADAKTIEHKFEYREALKEHLEQLIGLMHRLADVPNISPDQVKGLGQLSGFAIKLLYGSIISATNRNMIVWKPRLQRLFGKALFMLNMYETQKHYPSDLIRDADLMSILASEIDDLVEVKTQMPIPENEAELVDRETKKVAAMLESIKGAMDALGIENPEAKMAEIISEKTSLMEALGGLPDEGGSEGGNNSEGQGGGTQ